jgi:thiamine biosynthesis lipoprotein
MALHHVESVMGTMISIDIVDSNDASLIDELVRWFHHVDSVFSPYQPESEVSRIGRGGLGAVEYRPDDSTGDELRAVLTRCDELLGETRGVFDVWAVPSPNGTCFDPCGYVKGWSAQCAAELLEQRGVRSFFINAGGDVVVRGQHATARPWRVGIRHPESPDSVALVLHASGALAIATSGSYERGAHIVDPRTDHPATGVASATVVGPNLGDADAYATTLAVLGVDGLLWLAEREGYCGCVITPEGTLYSTAEFGEFVDR